MQQTENKRLYWTRPWHEIRARLLIHTCVFEQEMYYGFDPQFETMFETIILNILRINQRWRYFSINSARISPYTESE